MAKKPGKRQFDWLSYSKPQRLLTESQERSLLVGPLTPLLQLAIADPELRLEIRSRSAALYYRGVLLFRLTGEPFVAEFEAEGGGITRQGLETAEQIEAVLGDLASRRAAIDEAGEPSVASARRSVVQAVAAANAGQDLYAAEYVVIDSEYQYGKRRYDLLALKRTEGVAGPGGFAHARLVFADVRCCGQALAGASGLEGVGSDLAEFVKAASGMHLERAREEAAAIVEQKRRLGLLPQDLELRSIDEGLPELLVAFVGYKGLSDREHDLALSALHDRLVSRHFPPERLRFADLPQPSVAEPALREGDAVSYREFKDHRVRLRG